jgi:low affinity Fe/Cu permease
MPTEPELIRRERGLLRDLAQLAQDRVAAETHTAAGFAARNQAAEYEFGSARETITARFESERRATEQEYEQVRERAEARFVTEHGAAEREFADARDRVAALFLADQERASRLFHEVRWEATAVLDAARSELAAKYKEIKIGLESRLQKCRTIEDEAIKLLDEWRQSRDFAPPTPAAAADSTLDDLTKRLDETIVQCESHLAALKRLIIPQVFKGHRLRWAAGVFWGVVLGAMIALVEKPFTFSLYNDAVILICVIGPPLISLGVRWILAQISKAQVTRVCQPLAQSIADAEELGKRSHHQATADLNRQAAELQGRFDRDVRAAEESQAHAVAEAKVQHDRNLREVQEKYPRLLKEITDQRDVNLRGADAKYPRMLAECRAQFDRELCEVTEKHDRLLAESQRQHEDEWNALARKWWQGLAAWQAEIAEIRGETSQLFLDWRIASAGDWVPARSVPPAIRFGEFRVSMEQIPNGIPQDERLREAVPEDFSLPCLLPFPTGCSMLFKATDTGRMQAVDALQAVMLRFLTSIPPGKVRFTIIDPVGLGENFAAFMHLADHDEQLVTNRIWTEPQHIDQRLTDLTEHMENVIQKYLRNEFVTIEQYNAQAGEVAEPFRIVVVANFPANFTEATARRLVSIASSGARCGVYTLVSVDTKVPMPHGFNLADLEHYSTVVRWQDGRFIWRDTDFERLPLQLDSPPPSETFTDLLQIVGEKAKEAGRVEVPFEFIAPRPEAYWSGDSRPGINVPLGRAGATKTQNLRLGQGTSQHVLIAGKTGSGKSTLLHVLITNISLLYSPEEVQLYLVDFKKGVEFKTYAAYELPHARVVAIESEREFGLSVLQRLDAELKRRGDMFRDAGVQDLGGYRLSNGSTPLPRILLIVDEFQEFFVEDDKIAQEATLLLDRLVRQGRAFGIHVQLGSQTLGGAYSLARSTLGQMAVRIALQCSENDAHLILSDDNTAARLLSRPGEAIYNDANGLIEGNNFFQIVWLSDDRREEYLRRIQQLAQRRNYSPPQPQIVFEGNIPSDIRKNHLLVRQLAASDWPTSLKAPQAWLGEAVAIKDPTAAVFRPQVGSNMLMIGQQDEAALSIILTALVSLAAQHEPADDPTNHRGAKFYLLDGSSADAPYVGFLDKMFNVLPHSLQVAGPRDIGPVISVIAEEVDRRTKSPGAAGPAIYLFIYDLQRFRDLRKTDDDFSFSRRGGEDKPPSPAKLFNTILKEGPNVHVHTIIWCDSLNNLNRTFERQMIREFDMRVLFQMSPGDSSTLIDSPVAGKLGVHRALFYSEEQGVAEKFRPYGVPTDDWLAWVRDQLNSRIATAAATNSPSSTP